MEQRPVDARMVFLSDCTAYARDQVLFHMKHRDHWLKFQLVGQAGLLAIASGIEIGGLRADSSLPDMLMLVMPVSFVFMALYAVEDRMVAQFCGYIHGLSNHEANLSDSKRVIPNAEMFLTESGFAVDVLPLRLIAQIVTFLLIPFGLVFYRLLGVDTWEWYHRAELGVGVALWLGTAALLANGFRRHRRIDQQTRSRANRPASEATRQSRIRQSRTGR